MTTFIIEKSNDYVFWFKLCEFNSTEEGKAFNHFHYLCQEFPTMNFRLIKIQSAVIASN